MDMDVNRTGERIKCAVECKNHVAQIGRPVIQKFYAAIDINLKGDLKIGFVVTSNTFSNLAIDFCNVINRERRDLKIILIDREQLREYERKKEEDQYQKLRDEERLKVKIDKIKKESKVIRKDKNNVIDESQTPKIKDKMSNRSLLIILAILGLITKNSQIIHLRYISGFIFIIFGIYFIRTRLHKNMNEEYKFLRDWCFMALAYIVLVSIIYYI